MRAGLYLVFLSLGIACLIGGLFITRQTWRPEIEPFGRRSRMFQIAIHPERFATPERLGSIRALNFAGAIFIVCAVVVVTLDIISGIAGAS